MRIRFTKMQGAGNDFVVLDETQGRLDLSPAQYRFLADRHFGVGADQILSVRPSPGPGLDFEYVIHNADGGEVEHCGNGARCFVRYVRDKGLTDKTAVRVKVQQGEIELRMNPDGRVTVNMGAPVFDWERVPFNPIGLVSDQVNGWPVFDLVLDGQGVTPAIARVGVVSMGNPHAVQRVDNVDTAPVLTQGPLIENHPAFPRRVNAGFMQIVSRSQIRLRVAHRSCKGLLLFDGRLKISDRQRMGRLCSNESLVCVFQVFSGVLIGQGGIVIRIRSRKVGGGILRRPVHLESRKGRLHGLLGKSHLGKGRVARCGRRINDLLRADDSGLCCRCRRLGGRQHRRMTRQCRIRVGKCTGDCSLSSERRLKHAIGGCQCVLCVLNSSCGVRNDGISSIGLLLRGIGGTPHRVMGSLGDRLQLHDLADDRQRVGTDNTDRRQSC